MAIQVTIQPGLTPADVVAKATGYQDAPISAQILADAWGIPNLAAVARAFAKANGYTNLSIGDPIWDASTMNGPAQLEPGQKGAANFAQNILRAYVRLEPTGCHLVQIQEEVVLADHAIWDNRKNPDRREFKAAMSVKSSTSVESSWEHSQTVGIAAEIGTKIGPVDAKTSVSYEDSWGESHGESRGEDIEFSNDISGELEPGELQVAALTQQRGFATIKTDFQVVQPSYEWNQPTTQGFLVGFSAHGTVKPTYGPGGPISVSQVVITLSHLFDQAGKAHSVKNSRTDIIGVFADADLTSYPIPDTSEGSVETATGVHSLRTTYPTA